MFWSGARVQEPGLNDSYDFLNFEAMPWRLNLRYEADPCVTTKMRSEVFECLFFNLKCSSSRLDHPGPL